MNFRLIRWNIFKDSGSFDRAANQYFNDLETIAQAQKWYNDLEDFIESRVLSDEGPSSLRPDITEVNEEPLNLRPDITGVKGASPRQAGERTFETPDHVRRLRFTVSLEFDALSLYP